MNTKKAMQSTLMVVTAMTTPFAMALDLSKGYPSDAAERMDANKDGMISRDEYMKFHADAFEKMQNAAGLVPAKDMYEYLRGPGSQQR